MQLMASQGHSGLNRHKRADDPLNEEVIKVISEADRLQPDFVLIENVLGMAHARTDGSLNDEAGTSYADLAVKMLIGIGCVVFCPQPPYTRAGPLMTSYQVRIALLDAASYGAASYRKRVFFLGARKGVPLPTFPAPSHCNAKFQNPGMSEAARDMFGRAPGAAPFPTWTAGQATDDLPRESAICAVIDRARADLWQHGNIPEGERTRRVPRCIVEWAATHRDQCYSTGKHEEACRPSRHTVLPRPDIPRGACRIAPSRATPTREPSGARRVR
jgi:hypothetical protein